MALYSGISASVVRQLTYSSLRFGIYEEVKYRAGAKPGNQVLIATAGCSGFAGGLAGNFADVLNVRMQNDAKLSIHQRKNYRHVGHGMVRMAREEGLSGYMTGWLPNCTRAAAQTAGQLASYDIIKDMLIHRAHMADTPGTQVGAAFLASLIATTVTNPIDVIKTRVMSSMSGVRQTMVAVVGDAFRHEGPKWMVKGWVPSFMRIGP